MTSSTNDFATPNPALRAAKDITFGSIAGIVSKVFEHPFDLTKVRLQAQLLLDTPSPSSAAESVRFRGPIHCLQYTYSNEGFRGLYRGLPAPIFGAMFENASLFLAYNNLQSLIRTVGNKGLHEELTMAEMIGAGAGAGAFTSFILTPIELVKCKMQVQMLSPSTKKRPGPLGVLLQTIRETGIRGLWLGQTGTFIRETGGSAVWFGTKEGVGKYLVSRRRRPDDHVPPPIDTWESALSGACAGAAFNLAFFPADTVKSAMQTVDELRPSTSSALPRVKGTFASTFAEIYRTSGVRGLYAGCGITIIRSVPSSGMIFVIWDGLNRRFG